MDLPPIDPKLAEAMRMSQPTPVRITPVDAVQQYLAMPVPVLAAMQPEMVQCLCGKCQGVAVQFNARVHFLANGGPEVVTRPKT